MREKRLHEAVRCSLENFSEFDYSDPKDDGDYKLSIMSFNSALKSMALSFGE